LSNPDVPEQRGSITPPLKRSLLSILNAFIYNQVPNPQYQAGFYKDSGHIEGGKTYILASIKIAILLLFNRGISLR
jgi:hypothetical protein